MKIAWAFCVFMTTSYCQRVHCTISLKNRCVLICYAARTEHIAGTKNTFRALDKTLYTN